MDNACSKAKQFKNNNNKEKPLIKRLTNTFETFSIVHLTLIIALLHPMII